MCNLRTEYKCSQKYLFETIENLYKQEEGKSTAYHWGRDADDWNGDYRLRIDKQRIQRGEDGEITVFEEIGYINIGAINDDACLLKAIDSNPEIKSFYNYLVALLMERVPQRTAPAEMLQASATIRLPRPNSARMKEWQAIWRKTKSMWLGGGRTPEDLIEHLRATKYKYLPSPRLMTDI